MYGQQHVKIDLPGVTTATLEAFTCAECGYTEIYSDRLGLQNVRKYGRFLGRPESETGRVCPFCSAKVRPDATYCSECGNNI